MSRKVVLLGASGSIGIQTMEVIGEKKEFELVGVSIGTKVEKLESIISQFPIKFVCVKNESDYVQLKKNYPNLHFFYGDEGLLQLVSQDYDILVNALVGFVGLEPTLQAITLHKEIALANKETLVVGGELIKDKLKNSTSKIYPIDSEHSAIFQCIQGKQEKEIDSLLISASGGSFRDKKRTELENVTVKQALSHPNWSMGAKITIDSATMMNKGLEVIEAHYLFNIDYDHINTIMHRESIVHSMVVFKDQSVLAQMGNSDMRQPISYALLKRHKKLPLLKPLDLCKINTLHFEPLSYERFPLLELAYKVGRMKGNAPCIMNGANEQAVALFLADKISFLDIEKCVIEAVSNIEYEKEVTLQSLKNTDQKARKFVVNWYERRKCGNNIIS